MWLVLVSIGCETVYTNLPLGQPVIPSTPTYFEVSQSSHLHQPTSRSACPPVYTNLPQGQPVLPSTPTYLEVSLSSRLHQPTSRSA